MEKRKLDRWGSSCSHFFIHSAFGTYDVLDPILGTGNTNRSKSSSGSQSKGGENEADVEASTTQAESGTSHGVYGGYRKGPPNPRPACSRHANSGPHCMVSGFPTSFLLISLVPKNDGCEPVAARS